jgi:hypothetical protein
MTDLQFTIPEDITFPGAIALTQEILDLKTPAPEVLESAIGALVKTANGARGFFVAFLSGDSTVADAPPEAIVRALRQSPELVADLMAKNLAMSTAMVLTHEANGNAEQAAGSALTSRRSQQLIRLLALPDLQQNLEALRVSATQGGGEYQEFLDRWGYDDTQRQAIAEVICVMLGG